MFSRIVGRLSAAVIAGVIGVTALLAASPALAQSRTSRPEPKSDGVLGEKYVFEIATTWWTPNVFGVISSDALEAVGSSIDFTNDLGFVSTRFRDLRFVVRPAKKHRIRVQYTPIEYAAGATFTRDVTFHGSTFPVSVPIQSAFTWRVWRMGYEYDVFYRPRGFLGVVGEARFVDMTASIISAFASESVTAKAVMPALGVFGRAYVLPDLAVNFEFSGFKTPKVNGQYHDTYWDWDLYGTVNVTNNVGGQIGWRKNTTFLRVGDNTGDMKFEGLWFGFVLRY